MFIEMQQWFPYNFYFLVPTWLLVTLAVVAGCVALLLLTCFLWCILRMFGWVHVYWLVRCIATLTTTALIPIVKNWRLCFKVYLKLFAWHHSKVYLKLFAWPHSNVYLKLFSWHHSKVYLKLFSWHHSKVYLKLLSWPYFGQHVHTKSSLQLKLPLTSFQRPYHDPNWLLPIVLQLGKLLVH